MLQGGVCAPPAGGAEIYSSQKDGDPGCLAKVFPSTIGTVLLWEGQHMVPETEADSWTLEVGIDLFRA